MKTIMFPGQGSQSKGMGGDLFDEFTNLTAKADKILGYSIKELCLEDPRRELNKTQFTQPALYIVNALSFFKLVKDTGVKADFYVGHSLGEFNALMAAGAFDFETGLKLVKKRGQLMSQATDGGMAAILNVTKEQIEIILADNGLDKIDIANYNTPSQIVISGELEQVGKAQSFFQEGEMLYYPLNTSGAFHSRLMTPATEKFKTYLNRFKMNDIEVPVIANVTAQEYVNSELKDCLFNQISSTVKWSESIQFLMKLGAEKDSPMEFIEVGHGEVLTKMIANIERETRIEKSTVSASNQETYSSKQDSGASEAAGTDSSKLFASDSSAEEKVKKWNQLFPVGTKVKSTIFTDKGELETRTEAMVLFGHRAAIYIKGYNGYFDIDEIAPMANAG